MFLEFKTEAIKKVKWKPKLLHEKCLVQVGGTCYGFTKNIGKPNCILKPTSCCNTIYYNRGMSSLLCTQFMAIFSCNLVDCIKELYTLIILK